MKTVILTLCLSFSFAVSNAQVPYKFKIRNAIYDSTNGIQLIPSNIYKDSTEVLMMSNVIYLDSNVRKRGYSFNWNDASIDGSMCIEINQKQILVRSYHENPNNNNLYWFTDISPVQVNGISSYFKNSHLELRKNSNSSFDIYQGYSCDSCPKPNIKHKKKRNDEYPDYEAYEINRYAYPKYIIEQINKSLPSEARIPFPDKHTFESLPQIYIVSNLEELPDVTIEIIHPKKKRKKK